jgi:hypothetical protein
VDGDVRTVVGLTRAPQEQQSGVSYFRTAAPLLPPSLEDDNAARQLEEDDFRRPAAPFFVHQSSFATSNFKRIYEATVAPQYQDQVSVVPFPFLFTISPQP